MKNMRKVICVHPYEGLSVGKVYERAEWYVDGNYTILLDNGCKKHVGNGGRIPSAIFSEYIEPVKQKLTIEVPTGYKIKSQRLIGNEFVVEFEPVQNIVVVSASDTVLTIKPEFLEKLKALGVYEKWLSNVKAQWGEWRPTFTMNESDYWISFIGNSFKWSDTPEGASYWDIIRCK